jgi:ABC-type enterobactin transport system permease subunit
MLRLQRPTAAKVAPDWLRLVAMMLVVRLRAIAGMMMSPIAFVAPLV